MAVEVLGADIISKIKAQWCIDFARILALMRNVPNFVLYLPLIAAWFLLMVMAYGVKVDFPHPCVSRFVKLTVDVCGLALFVASVELVVQVHNTLRREACSHPVRV